MAQSCQYEGCNVPAEAGSKFCIFHGPSPKDLEKFKSALSDQLNEVGLAEDRNGQYLFDGYVFPTAIAVSGSPLDGIQLPQTIEGDASFYDAKIEGNTSFDGAKIKGSVKFDGAEIEGNVLFPGAKIEGNAVFANAQIKGDASFEKAQIKGNAVFAHAQIKGHASFEKAQIKGNAVFDGAKFEGRMWFDGAKFGGEAWFNDAQIEGSASFADAQIKGEAQFADAQIKGHAQFDSAQFEGGVWFAGVQIKGSASFADVQIEGEAWFDGCDCRSLLLRLNKPRIRGWGNERCGILISDPEAAVSFWRLAQRIFSRMGEREKADAAFYFERLNRWRVLRQNKADAYETWIKRLWKNWIIRPGYWILFLLDLLFIRWTTAYGASIARLFLTWFLVIGGFGITFSMVPRLIERAGVQQVWSLRNWIIGIHYSVTTFATLGLGRIGPGSSRLGMVLTSIEATVGAVLIALAVLVIGRRFMRQG